jgi:DNA-binding GntR family transcriptional regulator
VEAKDARGAREEMRAHLAKTAEDIEAAICEGMLDAGEPREKEGV